MERIQDFAQSGYPPQFTPDQYMPSYAQRSLVESTVAPPIGNVALYGQVGPEVVEDTPESRLEEERRTTLGVKAGQLAANGAFYATATFGNVVDETTQTFIGAFGIPVPEQMPRTSNYALAA